MDSRILRQLLRAPSVYRSYLQPTTRPQARAFALLAPTQHRYISLPRIIQPSFWASLIPKPFRRDSKTPSYATSPESARAHPKEWNPATPYIILSLLVGSQAIQILWLKKDSDHFARKAEAKIGLLREVIEKVQNGEDVDVEKVLGAGDSAVEREWRDVLKDIEGEDVLFRSKRKRRALRAAAEAKAETKTTQQEVQPKQEIRETSDQDATLGNDGKARVESIGSAKFY
jgi:hypothetical protein